MPKARNVDIDVADLTLTDPTGSPVPLASHRGVSVLVLMRHRH